MAPPSGLVELGRGAGVGEPGADDRRERLVDLERPDVLQREAAALERLLRRGDRRGEHDHRVDPGGRHGVDAGERAQAERGGAGGGRDEQRGRAVGDLRGVARGDHAAFPEGGPQPREGLGRRRAGCPRSVSRPATGTISSANRPSAVAAAARCWDRSAIASTSCRVSRHRCADQLGRHPLGHQAAVVPGGHHRPERTVPAGGARQHRHPRHRLHAAGDHDVRVPRDDGRRRELDRLLARAALPVDRHPDDVLRPARGEQRVAAHVDRLFPDLRDATPHHVVDQGGVEAGARGELGQHQRREVDRVDAGERALPRLADADRGADGSDENGVTIGHGNLPGVGWVGSAAAGASVVAAAQVALELAGDRLAAGLGQVGGVLGLLELADVLADLAVLLGQLVDAVLPGPGVLGQRRRAAR